MSLLPKLLLHYRKTKRLVELTREKSGAKFAVGDIYLGKVKKIMPSLNAAFVDVGFSKDAFSLPRHGASVFYFEQVFANCFFAKNQVYFPFKN